MAPVTPIRPMADGTLIEFFLNEGIGLTGTRLHRVDAAHGDLLVCFAEHLPQIDPGAEERLRLLRRGGDRPDAAARVAAPEVILVVLPFFLDEPRWHGRELQDRIVRSRLAWSLAQWIGEEGDSYEAVRAAVCRSQKAVRKTKADAARRHLEESGTVPPQLLALLQQMDTRRQEAETAGRIR
ncbi:hypothetical protein [uncultured Amnibacterium sp.]|uniref:hypothetical protein n=1 Tax=uncultured Amnibacterium sp. TaxID=1631851 RepID=UPI0035C998F8